MRSGGSVVECFKSVPVVQRVDNFTQWIIRYPTEQVYFNLPIWPDICKATHLNIVMLFLCS